MALGQSLPGSSTMSKELVYGALCRRKWVGGAGCAVLLGSKVPTRRFTAFGGNQVGLTGRRGNEPEERNDGRCRPHHC